MAVPRNMPAVVFLSSDLMFSSRVAGAASTLGVPLQLVAQPGNLAAKLKGAGAEFLVEPGIRFEGEAGEQATFFIADPSGNALKFKAFAREEQIFER